MTRRHSASSARLVALAVAVLGPIGLATSCTNETVQLGADGGACITGASLACACVDGRTGAQVCKEDGTLGPCACEGSDATAADGTTSDAVSSDGFVADTAVPDTAVPEASSLDASTDDGATLDASTDDGASDASVPDAPLEASADAADAADAEACNLARTFTLALTENIDTKYCVFSNGNCGPFTDVTSATTGTGTVTFDGTSIVVDAPAYGLNSTPCAGTPTAGCYRDNVEPYTWHWFSTFGTPVAGCLASYNTSSSMTVTLFPPDIYGNDPRSNTAQIRRSCGEVWHDQNGEGPSTCPMTSPNANLCEVARNLTGAGPLGCPTASDAGDGGG
jgi:hypothetical protein